jgi:hypothetical protein
LATDEHEQAERVARRALEIFGLPDPARADETAGQAAMRVLTAQGLEPVASCVWAHDPQVPAALRGALRQEFLRSLVGHRAAVGALVRLHEAFASAGISYALLKGPHLHEAFYADLGGRPYGDLDVAVSPGDADRATALMTGLGYRSEGGRFFHLVMRRFHFHETFRPARPGDRPVELHWALVDRFNLTRIDVRAVLVRARAFEMAGVPVRVPEPGDLLLYLCVHAAKHGLFNAPALRAGRPPAWFFTRTGGNRLIWFLDLWRLLDAMAHATDWPALAARVREWNILDEVSSTLALLDRVFPESPARVALARLDLPEPVAPATALERVSLALADRASARATAMSRRAFFRPSRFLSFIHAIFPRPGDLLRYHRSRSRALLPLLYLVHPPAIILRQFTAW